MSRLLDAVVENGFLILVIIMVVGTFARAGYEFIKETFGKDS